MSHDSNHTFEEGPFVYKFDPVPVWFAGVFFCCCFFLFFKVVTSTVTCKCSILTTRQRMT